MTDSGGWPRGSINYDYQGLSHWHVSVYAQEIALQIGHALRARRLLVGAVAREDAAEAFFYAQALLTAAGIVSQILWPAKHSLQARGSALRDAFGVTASSHVASRHLRDEFTHFDERIDAWTAEKPGHFTDVNIGELRWLPPEERPHVMRNLDPRTLIVSVRGEELPLNELVAELRDLATTLRDGGWQLHVSAFALAGELEP